MNDEIKEMVRLSRRLLASIWMKAQQGEALKGEEERIASVLRDHEQYRKAWEGGAGFAPRVNEAEGINPFLHIHIHLMVERQLRDNDPPEVREVIEELERRGMEEHAIMHCVGRVLIKEIYGIMKEKRPFDRARYVSGLRAMLREK